MVWPRLTRSNIVSSTFLLFMLVMLFERNKEGDFALRGALPSSQHQFLLPNSLEDYSDPKSTSLRGQKSRELLVADHVLQADSLVSSYRKKEVDFDISPPSPKVKVSYVTSLSADSQGGTPHPHRRETEAALIVNIHNPHFDQFVVFLQGVSEEASCSDFYKRMRELDGRLSFSKLTCIGVPGGQPTYYQMFQNALHEAVTGDVVVLSNADQAFDDTISLASSLNPEVLAVLGTHDFSEETPTIIKYFYETLVGKDYLRTDIEQQGTNERDDLCGALRQPLFWDTWIFHKSKIKDLKEEDFHQNMLPFYMSGIGAESAALLAVQKSCAFTSLYNACDRVHAWHFHLMQEEGQNEQKVTHAHGDPRSPILTQPVAATEELPLKNPKCVLADNCFLRQKV